MGRKLKIKKHKEEVFDDLDCDDNYYYEDEQEKIYKDIDKKYETITLIQTKTLKYCDDVALPLCNYMTKKSIEDFIVGLCNETDN